MAMKKEFIMIDETNGNEVDAFFPHTVFRRYSDTAEAIFRIQHGNAMHFPLKPLLIWWD